MFCCHCGSKFVIVAFFVYRSPQTDYAKQVKSCRVYANEHMHSSTHQATWCTTWLLRFFLLRQNGGKFDFNIDKTAALPVDSSFWDYLFSFFSTKVGPLGLRTRLALCAIHKDKWTACKRVKIVEWSGQGQSVNCTMYMHMTLCIIVVCALLYRGPSL